ncbi:MAG: type II toxin-antitoxin system HicA family toxin [Candidatus Vogelbacteria bacterium]|nr:type II toxin-antitoxin system HicA family toxin [Candidatus Vogelbacteria bacterium]
MKKLRKFGFAFRRHTKGTHEIWWSENLKRTCVVPHHKEIKVGTLDSIIDQVGVSTEEFLKK